VPEIPRLLPVLPLGSYSGGNLQSRVIPLGVPVRAVNRPAATWMMRIHGLGPKDGLIQSQDTTNLRRAL